MSIESKVPPGDELSVAIRAKVDEANQRQRHLNEAGVHARQILDALRPTLDEIAAYMHRETGLDVIAGSAAPVYLREPLSDSPTWRVATSLREVVVPTVPPTSLLGGFQTLVALDGTLRILAFWTTGGCQDSTSNHCWTELFEGRYQSADQGPTIKRAADSLRDQRHKAAEFLLDTLKES
jgi:hypothetical protein